MVLYPSNLFAAIRQYLRFDLKRELRVWILVIKFYLPITIPLLFVILGAFVFLKPRPTETAYLAIGQGGSLIEKMGDSYKEFFENVGLKLETVNTRAMEFGLHQLQDPGAKVNAAFVTSGTSSAKEYQNLVSLGSIEAAPLWLFHRGPAISSDDPFEHVKDWRIAIGAKGTASNKMFRTMMELNDPHIGDRPNFLALTREEMERRLLAKDLDAVFIVDAYASPIVQSLLNDPEMKLVNFPLADAYVRKLPYLQKVTVPKASIDISDVRPAQDVTLVATSINLLVEKDMHPAAQWAFLLATQDRYLKSQPFFVSTGPFPQYADKSFPLSSVADRFYKNGVPVFFEYLPLWAGVLIDRLWVVLLGLFLFLLPVIKKLRSLRSSTSEQLVWKHFWELRCIENLLASPVNEISKEELLDMLQDLDRRTSKYWLEPSHLRHYYNLKRCIGSTMANIKTQLEESKPAQTSNN